MLRRPLLPCFVLLALVGCKSAKGVEVDPRVLVPAEATVVAGFSVPPIRDSPLGPLLLAGMQSDRDMAAMVTAIGACNVAVDGLRGMIAVRHEGAEPMFATLQAPGIGDEGLVRCLEDEVGKATGEGSNMIVFETRGDVRITPQESGGYLVILNDHTLALVDAPWQDALFAAIEQPSARATDTPLARAIADVDAASHLWLAVQPLPGDLVDLTDLPGAEALKTARVVVDLAAGLKLDARLELGDAAAATSLAASLGPMIEEAKTGLGEVGLPATLLDGLTHGVDGSAVTSRWVVMPEALPSMLAALAPMLSE